jgi:hypothetical protein
MPIERSVRRLPAATQSVEIRALISGDSAPGGGDSAHAATPNAATVSRAIDVEWVTRRLPGTLEAGDMSNFLQCLWFLRVPIAIITNLAARANRPFRRSYESLANKKCRDRLASARITTTMARFFALGVIR